MKLKTISMTFIIFILFMISVFAVLVSLDRNWTILLVPSLLVNMYIMIRFVAFTMVDIIFNIMARFHKTHVSINLYREPALFFLENYGKISIAFKGCFVFAGIYAVAVVLYRYFTK